MVKCAKAQTESFKIFLRLWMKQVALFETLVRHFIYQKKLMVSTKIIGNRWTLNRKSKTEAKAYKREYGKMARVKVELYDKQKTQQNHVRTCQAGVNLK